MLPFKKIICPLDFSKPSFIALDDAIELALHFNAILGLVHVQEQLHPFTPDGGLGYYDLGGAEQTAKAKFQRQLNDIIKERIPAAIPVFSCVRRGHPAAEIVSFAEEHSADLIIIATHGLTGWRHLVFGSVTEKVVQTAPCQVLTVHRKEDIQLTNTEEVLEESASGIAR